MRGKSPTFRVKNLSTRAFHVKSMYFAGQSEQNLSTSLRDVVERLIAKGLPLQIQDMEPPKAPEPEVVPEAETVPAPPVEPEPEEAEEAAEVPRPVTRKRPRRKSGAKAKAKAAE
mgnify:CR=1 FL=1|jgi:hypothetical protein